MASACCSVTAVRHRAIGLQRDRAVTDTLSALGGSPPQVFEACPKRPTAVLDFLGPTVELGEELVELAGVP